MKGRGSFVGTRIESRIHPSKQHSAPASKARIIPTLNPNPNTLNP